MEDKGFLPSPVPSEVGEWGKEMSIKTDVVFVELRDRLLGRYVPGTSKIEIGLGSIMKRLRVYGNYLKYEPLLFQEFVDVLSETIAHEMVHEWILETLLDDYEFVFLQRVDQERIDDEEEVLELMGLR